MKNDSEIKQWLSATNFSRLVAASPREEFGQAKLRVILISVVYVYLLGIVLYHFKWDGIVPSNEWQSVFVGAFFVVIAIGISLQVLVSQTRISILRRVF